MSFWVSAILLVWTAQAQITIVSNGFIDAEPVYIPFTFFEGGREWPGSCATGKYQSPIEISDYYENMQIVTSDNSTFREFRLNTPVLPRNQTSSQIVQGEDIRWLFGTTFEQEILGSINRQTILEVHYTAPAEHTFNGVRYPLELHIVYALSQPDGSVVPGANLMLLYKEGKSDPFLEDFFDPSRDYDLSPLFPPGGVIDDYYYYVGSVDVPWPDCWEPLVWYMPNYILEASPAQIQNFTDPLINDFSFSHGHGLARDIQPLNNRTIYHYITPSDQQSTSFLS